MAESVYRALLNAIVKEDLRPGQRLVELKLSEELKVSRVPVREAIKRLEQTGLVKRLPVRGVIVKMMSEEDICEAFSILALLEGYAVARACHRMDEKLIDFLEDNIEATSEALHEGHVNEAANLDSRFHEAIVSAAGSEILMMLIKTLRGLTARRPRILPRARPAADFLENHRAMVEAMRGVDEKKAETIAKNHVAREETAAVGNQCLSCDRRAG